MTRYYLNKNILLTLWAASALLLSACGRDGPKDIEPTETEISMGNVTDIKLEDEVSSVKTVTFTTTGSWSVDLSAVKSVPWLQVSPMSGKAGTATLNITADNNLTAEERQGYINIRTADQTKSIAVTQQGDGTLSAGEQAYRVGPAGDTILAKLRNHTDYTIHVSMGGNWIVPKFTAQGEKYDSLAFIIPKNPTLTSRIGKVEVSSADGTYKSEVSFIQLSPYIPVELTLPEIDLVDSLAVAAFDKTGKFIFSYQLPETDGKIVKFSTIPDENNLQNVYYGSKIYVVANNTINFRDFGGTEADFLKTRDTAVYQLCENAHISPTMIGSATTDLDMVGNELNVTMNAVTAHVTFKIYFDPAWTNHPPVETIEFDGFRACSYLFPNPTYADDSDLSTPAVKTFIPDDSQFESEILTYTFYSYEGSLIALTARVKGGEAVLGELPYALERGKNYTFSMELCENGTCSPRVE